MDKIAFLFAGQGAQYPGMGRDLYTKNKTAKAVLDALEEKRPGTRRQCFEGTQEELVHTTNTQPCMFAVELAAAQALREAGVSPQGTAGFSLGEVAALTFAGAFSLDQGFSLVCRRGEIMEVAAKKYPGTMVAVLKLKNEQVERLCEHFQQVYPVNYNCEGQLVVAGKEEEMDGFCRAVAEAGGRAKRLAVGGGFHSPLMAEASAFFAQELAPQELSTLQIPVYANCTAKPYALQALKELLGCQLKSPVRWEKTIRNMADDGFNFFIEIGPGKTLSGLVKRILPGVPAFSVETETDVQTVLEQLRERSMV